MRNRYTEIDQLLHRLFWCTRCPAVPWGQRKAAAWACIFGMQPSTSGFTPLERATNEALHFVGDLQERLDALCAVPCDRKPTPRLPIRANEASVRNQPLAVSRHL